MTKPMKRLKVGQPVKYSGGKAVRGPWKIAKYLGEDPPPDVYRIESRTEYCVSVHRDMLTIIPIRIPIRVRGSKP